jgi:uncharacterized protein
MKSKVFLIRIENGLSAKEHAKALEKIISRTGFFDKLNKNDMVAIKLHVGEKNNDTHLNPDLVKVITDKTKEKKAYPFLAETSTLYKGERDNAVKHALHANTHGFSIEYLGAPFISLDGLTGTDEKEIEVNGEIHKSVFVAGQLHLADALVVISHVTGHPASGIGASIKNVGMGLSSAKGKMRQHSSITPEIKPHKCTNCGKCRKWCPEKAIIETDGVSFVEIDKCIGCGECIAVCKFSAVRFNYKIESPILQKSMAEHAAGALRNFQNKILYINVLTNMTAGCDCFDTKQKPIIDDIGITVSDDIVAIDQASLDLTKQSNNKNLSEKAFPELDPFIQIIHAQKLGLGNSDYALVENSE